MAAGIEIQADTKRLADLASRASKYFTERDLLNGIGLRHLRWVDQNFRGEGIEKKWRPLRPNTLASRRGGGGKILRDTGRLAQSFIHKVTAPSVIVGTESRIAPFHHFGTSPYIILPRNASRLAFKTVNGLTFARRVKHPGLPARPLLPTDRASQEMAIAVIDAALQKVDQ